MLLPPPPRALKLHLVATVVLLLSGTLWLGCGTHGSTTASPESALVQLHPLAEGVFVHTSLLATESWGKVSCNGLLVVDGKEALLLDTPADSVATEALRRLVRQRFGARITQLVPTHHHEDCLGGLSALRTHDVAVSAFAKTCTLAQDVLAGADVSCFSESENVLIVGTKRVELFYPGAGHAQDNIVAYLPNQRVLFGGCLVKTSGAGKGYLGDADPEHWPHAIQAVSNRFPEAQLVVPGHGKWGDRSLLDYTQALFADPVIGG